MRPSKNLEFCTSGYCAARRLLARVLLERLIIGDDIGDDRLFKVPLLDRKIAARLFRRFPRPVEARIIPDSYFSSMGSDLRRPHNHQPRTAMVTANWRG